MIFFAKAGSKFAAHTWRAAGAGNEGGWLVSRSLQFLSVIVGSVGTKGGTELNTWSKFHTEMPKDPEPQKQWNELIWPKEFPLGHFELSHILPYLIKEGRGKIDTYFSEDPKVQLN